MPGHIDANRRAINRRVFAASALLQQFVSGTVYAFPLWLLVFKTMLNIQQAQVCQKKYMPESYQTTNQKVSFRVVIIRWCCEFASCSWTVKSTHSVMYRLTSLMAILATHYHRTRKQLIAYEPLSEIADMVCRQTSLGSFCIYPSRGLEFHSRASYFLSWVPQLRPLYCESAFVFEVYYACLSNGWCLKCL